jgi:nitrogen regulatory protein PII
MYMIVFVLHDPERIKEVMQAWELAGVSGVTLYVSAGIGRLKAAYLMREDLPLMPSLEDFMESPERYNRTLMTIVKDETMVDRVVETTTQIIGDLDDPNSGILAVIPLSRVYGLNRRSA